jgi:hypothetical protein
MRSVGNCKFFVHSNNGYRFFQWRAAGASQASLKSAIP